MRNLNPVAVIVAIVFWCWLWGVAGALLAVPMLATFKIVCDRIERLMAIGHFLGTEAREMATSLTWRTRVSSRLDPSRW
jgi:predicted PurR-regulated permease PerM